MNKAILIGRLTKDPEKRTTQQGTSVASFSIACQKRVKNAQGTYDADFIDCVAWRATADFISKYFKKGDRIGVMGSIQTRSYEDKDGNKRYATEVNVEEAEFVESKAQKAAPTAEDIFGNELDDFMPAEDNDLPF